MAFFGNTSSFGDGYYSNLTTISSVLDGGNTTEITTKLQKFSYEYGKVHGYISVIVCLFGVVLNIANIVVLTRKNMITSTNVLLTWLAVADICKMLDYFPFAMHFYIFKDPKLSQFETKYYGWILFLLFHANFSIVCHTVAIWLTITLAIFRFLYIWFPTRGTYYCSIFKAEVAVSLVYVSVIIICIPNYIMNNMANITQPGTGDIIFITDSRDGGVFDYLNDINYYIQSFLGKLVPCFMLSILTILLVFAMHRAYRKRRALQNQGRREESDRHHEHNRTTLMLFAVVVLFLITELPQGILTLLIISDRRLQREIYNPLGDILDIVALCNNAINFVLYCSMSKQFRDTFVRIFCQCCTEQRPGWVKLKLITASQNGKTVNTTANMNATAV